MKTYFNLITVITVILIYSCQKNDISKTDSLAANQKTINSIKNYLNQEAKYFSESDKNYLDSFVNTLDWNAVKTSKHDNLSLVYIPSTNAGILAFINNNTNAIDSLNLVSLKGGNSLMLNSSASSVFGVYGSETNFFTGSLTAYDIRRAFKYEYGYTQGTLTYTKFLQTKAKNKNGAIRSNEQVCIDWYLVTTYANGTQDWLYLFQTCTDDCRQTYIGELISGSNIVKSNGCNGGRSGGTEENDLVKKFIESTQSFAPASILEDITTVDVDNFTKNKWISWTCLMNPYGAGTYKLISHEIGVVKLIDIPNDTWAWESLSHSSITNTGDAPPLTSVSYTNGIGLPTFTPQSAQRNPVYYAGLQLMFNVTYTFLTPASIININVIPPITLSYEANMPFQQAQR